MSPPTHKRDPVLEIPVTESVIEDNNQGIEFQIQETTTYDNVSERRCTGCLLGGIFIETVITGNVEEFMRLSTPIGEPEDITKL